jgi:hypothetical protein
MRALAEIKGAVLKFLMPQPDLAAIASIVDDESRRLDDAFVTGATLSETKRSAHETA